LAVFAERGGHARGGISTVGQWGAINLGASSRQTDALAASGAAALRHDALRTAWSSGALSAEKVRIVSRVATADSVERWVTMALEASTSQLARIASTFRRATAEPATDELRDRAESVGLWWENQPNGLVKLIALLEPDDAAVVRAALETMLEQQWRTAEPSAATPEGPATPESPDSATQRDVSADDASVSPSAHSDRPAATGTSTATGTDDTADEPAGADVPSPHAGPRRRAEALAALAESGLATGPVPMVGGERVVVHLGVDAAYLAGQAEAGVCHLHDLGGVDLATAQLLACDARIRAFVRGTDGRVVDEGREHRLVTTRQRRLLQHREGGCAYPGCTNHRFVDAHHAVAWYEGGPTDLDNLLLLCRRHHREQHRGGFSVIPQGDGGFRFVDTWGHDLGPPRQRASAIPIPAAEASTTRARSGGDPRYSLDLAVAALTG
jgi:hypothetical protein